MAVLTKKTIRLGFRAIMLGVSGITVEKIMFENRSFSTPGKGLWYKEHLILTGDQVVASDVTRSTGIYRFSIMVKSGDGTEEAEEQARLILAAVAAPRNYIHAGQQFVIEEAESRDFVDSGALQSEVNVWKMLSVLVTWRADTFRAV